MNDKIDELSKKLEAAKKTREESPENLKNSDPQSSRELSEGMRFAIELVAGVAVGAVIGYFLDQALGTIPIFLIIFIFIGAGAGFWNVYKASMKNT